MKSFMGNKALVIDDDVSTLELMQFYLESLEFEVVTAENGAKAIAVSTKAIVSENGKNYVIIYKDKCDLKVQEVQILKAVGNKTYIKAGLQEGDKVIADNQILLFKALTEK